MTLRLSTGLVNQLAQNRGFASIFNRGSIQIYSGSQPASADAAVTGTLLGTVTASSGALTKETRATGTIVITAAAGGSIDAVTVGTFNIIPDGAVSAVAGDVNATASALCDAINRNGIFDASVSSATVTIKPKPGVGTSWNGLALTASLTTVTATYGGGTVSGGIAPVNGLIFGQPAAGVIGKLSTQVWSFAGIAAGTAGWARLVASEADAGGVVSGAPYYPRLDMSVAVSGADLNLSNIAIAVGAPNTVDTFSWTQPQS
jgi:hypothetical protein